MKALRFVGLKRCNSSQYLQALSGGSAAIIDTLSDEANVALRFERDGKPLHLSFDAQTRDFLDLSALIYIVDEIEDRSAAADLWTRTFEIIFPVRNPATWSGADSLLRQTLSMLAGDDFSFIWPERSAMPPLGRHRTSLPRGFDSVCLFSGGIDSFLGAYSLLRAGKKVLLVGHQAEGISASAQTELAEFLREKFPKAVSLIQCRVARSLRSKPRYKLPDKKENSHRPRSFLFLGLGVAIANAAKIREVFIPENGLIAINPPLQKSRLGTLSTRTVHPAFLSLFADFLAKADIYSGTICNPFLYESKTDMLRNIDPALKDILFRSVSCAHAGDVHWIGEKKVRHCGYCVPCIYRRIAMMAAKVDRSQDYAFDIFQELSTLTYHRQADFRALFRFARRIIESSVSEREMMVLSHGVFAPEIGSRFGPHPARDLSPWSDMLLRWAEDFVEKAKEQSSHETRRILGIAGTRHRVHTI